MFVAFDSNPPKQITYTYKFTHGLFDYFMGNDGAMYKINQDAHGRIGDMINADDDPAVRDYFSVSRDWSHG